MYIKQHFMYAIVGICIEKCTFMYKSQSDWDTVDTPTSDHEPTDNDLLKTFIKVLKQAFGSKQKQSLNKTSEQAMQAHVSRIPNPEHRKIYQDILNIYKYATFHSWFSQTYMEGNYMYCNGEWKKSQLLLKFSDIFIKYNITLEVTTC